MLYNKKGYGFLRRNRILYTKKYYSLDQPNFVIELIDQFIDFRNLFLEIGPVIPIIPLGLDLFIGFSLLLNPSEVFQIVDSALILIGQILNDSQFLSLRHTEHGSLQHQLLYTHQLLHAFLSNDFHTTPWSQSRLSI